MKRRFVLEFNLAASPQQANRLAIFENEEQMQAYVDAERFACRAEYMNLCRSCTVAERQEAKTRLDSARWEFYKNWANSVKLNELLDQTRAGK